MGTPPASTSLKKEQCQQTCSALARLNESGHGGVPSGLTRARGSGAEAAAAWADLRSAENYLGYARTQGFLTTLDAKAGRAQIMTARARSKNASIAAKSELSRRVSRATGARSTNATCGARADWCWAARGGSVRAHAKLPTAPIASSKLPIRGYCMHATCVDASIPSRPVGSETRVVPRRARVLGNTWSP